MVALQRLTYLLLECLHLTHPQVLSATGTPMVGPQPTEKKFDEPLALKVETLASEFPQIKALVITACPCWSGCFNAEFK